MEWERAVGLDTAMACAIAPVRGPWSLESPHAAERLAALGFTTDDLPALRRVAQARTTHLEDAMTDTAPTRASAGARIAAGLAARPREHHGKRLADAFRHDAEAERMLALRESRPEAYAALHASTRTGLAYYSGAREAARALGIDVSAPAATS